MGFPSITTIVSTIFLSYVTYSIYSIGQLFFPSSCDIPNRCLHSSLSNNPKLQLAGYSSIHRNFRHNAHFLFAEEPFDYNKDFEFNVDLSVPKSVRQNGSLYLHLFLINADIDPEDTEAVVSSKTAVYTSTPLVSPEIPIAATFNLLEEKKENKKLPVSGKPVSHLHSVIKVSVLNQDIVLDKTKIPHEFFHLIRLSPPNKYLPILYVDLFSQRQKDLIIVNKTTSRTNFTFQYSPISFGKLRLWLQFYSGFQSMKQLGFTEKDIDEVKALFTDTNMYFLLLTVVIATFHMLFDFLAFKNDISFWKSRDDLGGISASSVLWRCFAQIIIFFYLMEEETSLLVLIPAAIGALIEVWKVCKKFHIEFDGWKPILKGAQSAKESTTNDLDSEAFKYLSYVLYPLCLGGAVYSLVYVSYKSWYSWVINSLVNGVYAFGFLFMLPQLFINYRLKSVAHLPWKAFMYKAFNTFIDDFFAFVITMPTSHRLACFRDDIVFLIYLYQKWLYPVDKTRVNEFGQVEEHKKKE